MENMNFIDLGLPSGTLWADRNVGAENPTDAGTYVAWGEKEGKESYYLNNYSLYGVISESEDENVEQIYGYTKYNIVDGKKQLDSIDEVANTPSKEQWEELFANTSMSIQKTEGDSSVTVAVFTSENGNSIKIPVVGCKHEIMQCGSWVAEYWTKDLASEENAYRAYFGSEVGATINQQWRIIGMPIRPVSETK